MALLIIYYAVNPLLQWMWTSFLAFYAIYTTWRANLIERRAYMEAFDEALLASIAASTNRAMQKQQSDARAAGHAPVRMINSEMGRGGGGADVAIQVQPEASYTLGIRDPVPPPSACWRCAA